MAKNFTSLALAAVAILFLSAFVFEKPLFFTVVYVDKDATGNNDGTSWADAFVDLKNALAAAQADDMIWVAEGVYRPDTMGGSPSATFHISQNIQLYGGFSGTEASLDQRDPDNHLTILSGDLNADDISNDLDSNRSDNVRTVLLIDWNINDLTMIDGFTIRNGHAVGNDSLFYTRRGGGLFSFGAPQIRQCRFVENYGDKGGGLYFHGPDAAGTQLVNCFFEKNGANEGGAMMAFYVDGEGVLITDCQFQGNHAGSWGGAIRVYNSNLTVGDVSFFDNTSNRGGGAIETRCIVDNNETALTGCTFSGNQSRQGGAVRFQTSSGLGSHNNKLTISACNFENNEAIALDSAAMGGRTGGAIHAIIERTTNGGKVLIEGSGFTGNGSEQDASAIMAELEGVGFDFQLKACVFQGNAAGRSGGVTLASSEVGEGEAVVENCLFQNNTSAERNSGLVVGGDRSVKANFNIRNCTFFENMAEEWGAGLSLYCRDTATVDVKVGDCFFIGNTAGEKGGAVLASADNDQMNAVFEKCIFEANQGPQGAAIAVGKLTTPGLGSGSTYIFDNCLFYENVGADGVIHCDSFPSLSFINSTIAHNQGGALFQISEGGIALQNTILFNPGFAEFTGPASGTMTVLGGNLIGDGSLDAMLTINDQSSVDPLFTNSGLYPFQLTSLSTAINKGTAPDETPDLDIAGNPRIQNGCIDAGAFESAFTAECFTATNEAVFEKRAMSIYPNPVSEIFLLKLENEWRGEVNLHIVNILGQIIPMNSVEKTGPVLSTEIGVAGYAPGVYVVFATQGNRTKSSVFVKE